MPEFPRAYRLRIRDQDDLADALVLTSIADGVNPYISEEPTGDGLEIDLLAGTARSGSYTVQVADAEPDPTGAPGVRVVTSELADAGGRQQLLSRRAYLEVSENDGGDWTILVPGYVTGVRLVDAITYEFEIGDTRRIERSRKIWTTPTERFPGASCLIGGPIRGGFGPLRDFGPWLMEVTAIDSSLLPTGALGAPVNFVTLSLVEGWVFLPKTFDVPTLESGQAPANHPGEYRLIRGTNIGGSATFWLNARARPFGVETDAYAADNIRGHFPGLVAEIAHKDTGAVLTRCRPLGNSDVGTGVVLGGGISIGGKDLLFREGLNGRAKFNVAWGADDGAPLPALGDRVRVYVYPRAVSEEFPMHVQGHPVDLAALVLDELEQPYDAAKKASARAAVGPLRLMLRITEPPTAAEALERILLGPWGVVSLVGTDGETELASVRLKGTALPAETITIDDLQEEGQVYDLQEATVVNRVAITHRRYEWPADSADVVDRPETVEATNGDAAQAFGDAEVRFDIPGTILFDAASGIDLEAYVAGFALEVFDRRGRGAIDYELPCLPGVAARQGTEVYLDLPHLPNGNVRGGLRVAQVVRRTEGAAGPDLKLVDSGVNAQPATLPAFTLTKSAASPRSYAEIVLTNAAALAAAGERVRVEMATGAVAGDYALLGALDPAVTDYLRTPRMNAGTKVWIRLRAEEAGKRPGAYTAAQSVQLDAIGNPSALGAASLSPSSERLTWTLPAGGTDVPVLVYLRRAIDVAYRLVATLPAGSTTHDLSGLIASTDYIAAVELREAPPSNGASALITAAFTTAAGGGVVLPAPANPAAWAGTAGDHDATRVDGTFGIDVTARAIPSSVVVEVAIETAIGSGVPGAYEVAGVVPSAQSGRTRWAGRAPYDRRRRYLRARHEREGDTPSAYTAVVSVDPWAAAAPGRRVRRDEPMDDGDYGARATDADGRVLDPDVEDGSGAGRFVTGLYHRTLDDADQILPGATTRTVALSHVDASGRPVILRDPVLVEDVDANDINEGQRRARTALDTAANLNAAVKQSDGVDFRALVKGQQGYPVKHREAVEFTPLFNDTPSVRLWGGVVSQPESKWGTATEVDNDATNGTATANDAPAAATRVYEDMEALNLDAAGFEVRARLKQKSVQTPRSHNFPLNNDLDVVDEATEVTLANAPSSNDQYTAHYEVVLQIQANSPGNMTTIDITVAVETWNGLTWSERATRAYSAWNDTLDLRTFEWLHEQVPITVSGLTSTSKIRLKLKTRTIVGGGGGATTDILVHGFDGSGDPADGVTYSTSSGDKFASKTPDADDFVRFDAISKT